MYPAGTRNTTASPRNNHLPVLLTSFLGSSTGKTSWPRRGGHHVNAMLPPHEKSFACGRLRSDGAGGILTRARNTRGWHRSMTGNDQMRAARQRSIGCEAKGPQGHGNTPKHTGKTHDHGNLCMELIPGCTEDTKLHYLMQTFYASTSLRPTLICKQILPTILICYCHGGTVPPCPLRGLQGGTDRRGITNQRIITTPRRPRRLAS